VAGVAWRRWAGPAAGWALGLALCALAWWTFGWLGASLDAPINHGENEDWDWQLTMYEASRAILMEHHRLPAWTPWTQGGVPLLANPEAPFLYPPFALVLALGTTAGIKVWVLLHLWLLVYAAWLAGREIGLSPAAAHGAALVTLCSAFLPGFIQYGHIMYLPLGWLPLAWVAQRRGRWPWAGAALAMSFLAGGHYLLVYGALWLGIDGLLRGLERERLRWLAAPLVLNGLLMGQGWAAWPLGLALAAAALYQRPGDPRRAVGPALMAGAIAALILGVKLACAPALFERAERLAAQVSVSVADPYTPMEAWRVLVGALERPSGHEGQNVFWHPAPVVLGLAGLAWAGWRRPLWGVAGLIWWNLGWGGATPVNLLQGLHRLPGFDLLRVVERYSLVWTLFLGWGAGAAIDASWRRWRPAGALAAAAMLVYTWHAAPQAASLMRLGPGRQVEVARGDFLQTDDDLSNFEAAQANRGKIDCWTTAWLADPAPGLRAAGAPGYRGEVWLAETGAALPAKLSPGLVEVGVPRDGTVVVNQNAFRGWEVHGGPASAREGLLAAELSAGIYTFRYRPPGLTLGLILSALGLAALAVFARSRAPAPATRSTAPPP